MRGFGNSVSVVRGGLGRRARSSSYRPPQRPTVLGPKLPDVWIPSSSTHRPQSSAIFRESLKKHFLFLYLYINSFCFLRALKCWHSKPAKGQTAAIIDGKSIAHDIKSKIAGEIRRTKAATGKCPGLAVVLVGKRRDSRTFMNIKQKACDDVGIATRIAELPETCTESELLHVVSGFNEDPSVHGIIVQLPLPQVISTTASDFELLPLFIYYAFKAF